MNFSNTKKLTIACVAMMAFVAAQAPPAAPAKKFKDDKEQTEAIAANVEKDPKAQIEKLDKWKSDYPETQYEVERLNLYFQAYGKTKQWHEQIGVAQQLLVKFPDSLTALRSILVAFSQISSPSDDDRKAATDAARTIIDHQDAVFAPGKAKENGMTDAQWEDGIALKLHGARRLLGQVFGLRTKLGYQQSIARPDWFIFIIVNFLGRVPVAAAHGFEHPGVNGLQFLLIQIVHLVDQRGQGGGMGERRQLGDGILEGIIRFDFPLARLGIVDVDEHGLGGVILRRQLALRGDGEVLDRPRLNQFLKFLDIAAQAVAHDQDHPGPHEEQRHQRQIKFGGQRKPRQTEPPRRFWFMLGHVGLPGGPLAARLLLDVD